MATIDFSFTQKSLEETLKGDTRNFVDSRFYTLTKDDKGNGEARIRLLKGPDNSAFVKVFRSSVNNPTNRKFATAWSLSTIGEVDPYRECFSRFWNAGMTDEAKWIKRNERFLVNILVVDDPAKPENNGKVFILDLSKTLQEKIAGFMNATGRRPFRNLFDPFDGYDIYLTSRKGANGIINYDSTELAEEATAAFDSVEEATDFIVNNAYALTDIVKDPSFYKSYEECEADLERVYGPEILAQIGMGGAKATAKAPAKAEAPAKVEAKVEEEVEVAKPKKATKPARKEPETTDEDLLEDLLSSI